MQKYAYHKPDRQRILKLLESEYLTPAGTIVRLAWLCGLAASELSTLTWGQVDYENATIHLQDRDVPIPEQLISYLHSLQAVIDDGQYVVTNAMFDKHYLSRVNISRYARIALDYVGQPDITLADLRFDYIDRLVESLPLEQVARQVGMTPLSLQLRYKERAVEIKNTTVRDRRKQPEFDEKKLLELLEKEGHSIAASVIRLSWMGGLSLPQILQLKWDQVSLENREIKIGQVVYPISDELYYYLIEEKPESNDHLLTGMRSNKPLEHAFTSRKVRGALIAGGLESLKLSDIKGKRAPRPIETDYSGAILRILSQHGSIQSKDVVEKIGLPIDEARNQLNRIVERGQIVKVGKAYYPIGAIPEDSFDDVILDYLKEHGTISRGETIKLLGVMPRQVAYYLQKAVAAGKLIKCGYDRYCTPDINSSEV